MITIQLDAATEEKLRMIAEAQQQEVSALASRVLGEYLQFHLATADTEEEWAESAVALAPEVIAPEPALKEDSIDGSR